MVVLLNIALPLLVTLILFISWKCKSWKALLVIPALVIGYGLLQPSYLPKGTVQKAQFVAPTMSDKPVVDRMLKPVDPSVRDATRIKQLDETDEMVEKLLSHKKEN